MASATARPRYRPRVTPRGRSRGPASRIHWDRLGRVVLLFVLAAVLISYVGPALHVVDSWRESRAVSSRLAVLKTENDQLHRQAEQLKDPASTIIEARKLGLVGTGERAYVVDGTK